MTHAVNGSAQAIQTLENLRNNFDRYILPAICLFLRDNKHKDQACFSKELGLHGWSVEFSLSKSKAIYHKTDRLASDFVKRNPQAENTTDVLETVDHINQKIIKHLKKQQIDFDKGMPWEKRNKLLDLPEAFFNKYVGTKDANEKVCCLSLPLEITPYDGVYPTLKISLFQRQVKWELLHPYGDQNYELPKIFKDKVESLAQQHGLQKVETFTREVKA